MSKEGKYDEEERRYLENLATEINANKLSFGDAVQQAVSHLGRSEKGVALYMGRMTRKVAGNSTRRRRSRRMPAADAKASDLVRHIQSLSSEYRHLSVQRDGLDKRIGELEDRLRLLKDRLLKNLGIAE